jgi:hypothetical protein
MDARAFSLALITADLAGSVIHVQRTFLPSPVACIRTFNINSNRVGRRFHRGPRSPPTQRPAAATTDSPITANRKQRPPQPTAHGDHHTNPHGLETQSPIQAHSPLHPAPRTIPPEPANRRPWTPEARCPVHRASPLARHRSSSPPLGTNPGPRGSILAPLPTNPHISALAHYSPDPPYLYYPPYPPRPPKPRPRPLNPCPRPQRRIHLSPSTPSMPIGNSLSQLSPNVKLRNRPSPCSAKGR